jgi:hypothetical protein
MALVRLKYAAPDAAALAELNARASSAEQRLSGCTSAQISPHVTRLKK